MFGTAKHKYATTGFIYLFGLICASFINGIASLVIFVVLTGVCFFLRGRKKHFILFIAVIAAAFLIMGLYRLIFIESCYRLAGRTVYVTGKVTECLSPDNDTVMLSVSGTAEGTAVKFTLFTADTGISAGDSIEFTAMFSRLADTGYFAEESYYYSKGIFLKAYARGDITVTEGTGDLISFVGSLPRYFKESTGRFLNEGSSGIVNAMLFGDKSGLSTEQKMNIIRSGVSHLTAVSGMHLSLLVCLFMPVIGAVFGRRRLPSALVSVCFIAFLMVFFGLTASVMRSGFMMIICCGSYFFRRKSDTAGSVGGALLIILLAEPCACRDVGLWLSVLGTLGVGVLSPAVCKSLKHSNYLIKAVSASLCAAVCTAPVGMLCFGGISVLSFISSVVLQPFFVVIITLVPAAVILPFLTEPLLFAAGGAAKIMECIVSLLGGFPYSYVEADSSAISIFLAVSGVFSVIAALLVKRRRPVAMLICVSAAAFAGALALSDILGKDNIELSVYSDGKNAVVAVSDSKGISLYTREYNDRTEDMIYECITGKNVEFICISDEISDNLLPDYECTVHTPEKGNMYYDVSGEYGVIVHNGEIIFQIRGITAAILSVDSDISCDAAIYTGYAENFSGGGKAATILCDKRFYNYNDNVNACYEKARLVINKEGMLALKTD